MARLNPLRVSGLDSAASPAAFGAGRSLESFGGGAGPVGYGAGLRIPTADAVGYGAGAARDLAALGNVGLNAADAALRVQRQDAVLSGRRKELAARSEFQKVYMERQAAAPADAKDFTKSTMEAFDQFKNGQLDGLTGVERDIVEKSLLKFQNSVYSDAVGFETKRKFEARKNDVQSMVDIASNAVFSRPADLIDVRNGVLSTIAESDLPDFAKQELAATATAALAKPYFLAQVQRDPYAAREVLTKGDPGALQGLEFGDRAQLLNAADTEIRGLEAERRRAESEARARAAEARAEQRAAQAEARDAARIVYQDELAAAERGTTANPNAAKIISAAFQDKAGPILETINRAREAAGVAADFATMTPGQISDEIARMAPGGDGFASEAKTQEELGRIAQKVIADRASKPAESVVKAFPGIAQDMASGDPQRVGTALRQSANVQTAIFGLPPDQVRVLPPGLTDTIVSQFDKAATADERLGVLAQYTTALGDEGVARRVLSELEAKGLPPGARFALERVQQGDLPGARAILGGLTTDPAKLPKLAETQTAKVAEAVDARMAEPSSPAGLTTALANMSQQPRMFQRTAGEREELVRLATQFTASGADPQTAAAKAEATLFGDVKIAGNADLGYVRATGTIDPDALTSAMERLRAGLDLSYLAPPVADPANGAAAGEQVLARRDFQAWAQSVRDGGIFTDAEGGYALMAPAGGFLMDPADPKKVRIFTPQQILDLGRSLPPAKIDPGLVLPGIGP